MQSNEASKKAAAVAVTAAAAWWVKQQSTIASTVGLVVAEAEQTKTSRENKHDRYLRVGALPKPSKSFWSRVNQKGDDLEFLHFTSFTRKSFEELVDLCKDYILSNAMTPAHANKKPKLCHKHRHLFKPRDIVAMTLQHLCPIPRVTILY